MRWVNTSAIRQHFDANIVSLYIALEVCGMLCSGMANGDVPDVGPSFLSHRPRHHH